MKTLAQETRNVQNPALGAGLLWRFACGYTQEHPTHEPVPLPLLFVVLPIVLHEQTESIVASTQGASGLRAFATKFGKSENSMQDVLLAVHDRAAALRTLTRESLRIALMAHLIGLSTDAAAIPLSRTPAGAGMPPETRRLMKSAERLGAWCGRLTIHEVAATLKVRF
ncbi:MAG TPA: three component ABC system middle component [bacterium]|nr:three component ABC system middle component [bacterium]